MIQAPNGKCFVIDTKSNKGSVFYDGAVLKLRYGQQVYEFGNGKNILRAVKGQARALKDMKRGAFRSTKYEALPKPEWKKLTRVNPLIMFMF